MSTLQQIQDMTVLPPSVEDAYPLTPVQEGMLFHALYEQRGEVYLTR